MAYNGWTNRATWAIALWLDNEYFPAGVIYSLCEAFDCELEDAQSALPTLGEIEDWLHDFLDTLEELTGFEPNGLLYDLYQAAVGSADFGELARHYQEALLEERQRLLDLNH